MATVKTAISIRKSLFEQVNDLAEELEVPRSQLFVLAVEEFIKRYQNRKMLETLNEVYTDGPGQDRQVLREGMRRPHRQLVEGQW
jgi:metal-responsive CopG/Arc/MetJ family transcriptional regulator